MVLECISTSPFMEPRIGLLPFNQKTYFRWGAKSSSGGAVEKHNHSSLFIDKRCKIRSFNHKKLSRKKGNSETVTIKILRMHLCIFSSFY